MYKGMKLKPCPKCGHEEGLINCPVCHKDEDRITIVFDGKAWKVWEDTKD